MRILDTHFPVVVIVTVFSALLIGFVLADHHVVSDIVGLDENILFWANANHNQFITKLMYELGNFHFLIPFYGFLALMTLYYDRVKFMRVLIFIGLYVLVCDGLIFLINLLFEHLRPLYLKTMAGSLQIETGRIGKQFGCLPISSSAAGIAYFSCLYFKKHYWPLKAMVVTWAAITLYANLYYGWNYPHEILIAAVISLVIAHFTFKIYLYYLRKGKLTW